MPGNQDIFYRSVQSQSGMTFGSLVRAESAMIYDKVIYVDMERGADGKSGTTPKKACKTINGALDKLYGGGNDDARGRHYAIIYQCRTTTGQAQTAQQVIDIEGVHLIGAGLWFGHGGGGDSCLVCGSASGYASPAHLKITRSNCSVEGIKFYTPSEYGLGSEEYYIYAANPTDLAIVNCQFIGANANGDCTGLYSDGVYIEGSEGAVLSNNEFLYCYRGIVGKAGTSRYFHKNKIENNRFFSNDIAIYFSDGYAVENCVARNIILQKSNYGYAMTAGIKMLTAGGNFFVENYVGHATNTTAFTKGSGTNYWALNYHSGSGGTLYAEA